MIDECTNSSDCAVNVDTLELVCQSVFNFFLDLFIINVESEIVEQVVRIFRVE